jgi:hypothetical protein
MKQIFKSLFFLMFLSLPLRASAFDPWSEPMGARGLALGGAVIATGTGGDAMTTNPASMGVIRSYIWENYYRYNTREKGHITQTSLVDSFKNPNFAAGVYLLMSTAEPTAFSNGVVDPRDEIYMKGGLALSFRISQSIVFGVNGYYFDWSPEEGEGRNGFTMDVGMIAKLGKIFTVGAVVYDVLSDHDDNYPLSYGAGAAVSLMQKFTVEVDIVMEGDKPWYKGGAELMFGQGIVVRGGGGRRERQEIQYFSFGMGYITKKSSIEFSIMQNVDGSKNSYVGLDLRFFLR